MRQKLSTRYDCIMTTLIVEQNKEAVLTAQQLVEADTELAVLAIRYDLRRLQLRHYDKLDHRYLTLLKRQSARTAEQLVNNQ